MNIYHISKKKKKKRLFIKNQIDIMFYGVMIFLELQNHFRK